MSQTTEKKTFLLTIKAAYIEVVVVLTAIGVLSVGVTGIYFGSQQQLKKDAEQLERLRAELKDQQLVYEKRLGEQSARYALEAQQAVQSLQQLQSVITAIQTDNKKYAQDRQEAMRQATAAAQVAASEAKAARDRLADLTVQTKETSVAVAVAASAAVSAASSAKETQRTLENATYPVAQPPKRGSGK
jgi:DNA repair exonuclease SbcCD ATPase subunit